MSDGHEIKLLIKTKDILEILVQEDGWQYENILSRKNGNGVFHHIWSLLKRDFRILRIARKFKPDILMGSDASVTQVGWLLGKPRFAVGEDDYSIVRRLHWLMLPFATTVFAPEICHLGPFERKKIAFDSYMKLTYLHPDIFQPDKKLLAAENLKSPFCLIRMVDLSAYHDNNCLGLNGEMVEQLIQFLDKSGYHVYIDTENDMPKELKEHQLKIKKTRFHHILALASLVITDSQSLSVEASVLGVPSIRFNDFAGKISVLEELEHTYQLTFGIPSKEPDRLLEKVQELILNEKRAEIFRQRKEKMLQEKINPEDFFVWFLGSFPESFHSIRGKVVNKEFMANIASDKILYE